MRRSGKKVERDHKTGLLALRGQGPREGVFGLELCVGISKAHLDRVAIEQETLLNDVGFFERTLNPRRQRCIDPRRGSDRRNLNGRRFAKKIGRGVQRTQ